jgi:glycosyltransferase involved in cell wall biosynthesis
VSDPALSLVLPCYNEEANLRPTLDKCARALEALGRPYEIVLVDDASTDGTAAMAAQVAAEIPALRVVRNPVNLGAGTSLLVGMAASRGAVVVHDSMDYPFDLADLREVLPLFTSHDVVIVARRDRSAHSPYRRLTSLVHYWLVRLLFRVRFRDMNFVQAYKREVIQAIRVRARSPAFVTPEALIRARDLGFKVGEVTATFHPRTRGSASYGKPRDILWALADILSFWLERRRQDVPQETSRTDT